VAWHQDYSYWTRTQPVAHLSCWIGLDDATSEIYYAQLVAEESTRTVMAALRSVVEKKGWFSSVYSDRASHFFRTPKAGQPVDTRQVTEVGRAMRDLGIRMIPAYSPQARGRSERSFGTWQGRLPQELRLKNSHTPEEANAFLNAHYIGEFNRKFMVAAAETGAVALAYVKRAVEPPVAAVVEVDVWATSAKAE